jgi:hypothetical protein
MIDVTISNETTFLDSYNKGITCTKCRAPVNNYDLGSARYQEHYGKCLPAICDSCLNWIFHRITGEIV